MLDYDVFKDIFDNKIFAKSKSDLLKKVAEYPDRYVGLFRPTKPEAKLLQNLLQSNEIRFGDAFEVAIRQYFILGPQYPSRKAVGCMAFSASACLCVVLSIIIRLDANRLSPFIPLRLSL